MQENVLRMKLPQQATSNAGVPETVEHSQKEGPSAEDTVTKASKKDCSRSLFLLSSSENWGCRCEGGTEGQGWCGDGAGNTARQGCSKSSAHGAVFLRTSGVLT